AWQERALRPLLSAAADRVPHYRDSWDAGARAGARRGELGAVPLLGKEPLRADPSRFLDPARAPSPALGPVDGAVGRQLVFPTSGSSGTPVRTIWTAAELRASMAVREVRSAGWAGVSFRDPRATFSGRIVVPDPDSTGPFHRWNAVERQAYLSTFHLRAENAQAYAEAFRRHGLVWGTGYAQSFARLGRHLLDQGADPPRLRAVIATSEKLSDGDRRTIEEAFSCVVREEYSSIENAVLATECERGSLHVSPDVGVVEILRPDGTAAGPGEVGEVVATGFLRRRQPLIRYRIGDLAAWADEPCACGRAMPVLAEVVGRVEDVLIGPDGRRVTRFHGVFYEIPGLVEAQVVQRTNRRFTVRVVVTDRFDEGGAAVIVGRMIDRLGSAAEVDVEPVDAITRTAAGKFRAVVSERGS
ncbi:MAG: phenylacetate--CoA ligase family protein, partial [Acidimicrobiales bacterium]